MSEIQYFLPMSERLKPRTPWAGGRITDTDVLTLEDAASMATKHAGEPVTTDDILRAAGRGEITLRAILHRTAKVQKHDGGIYCNAGQENENTAPAGAIATLPLSACQHLAAAGRASWRTFDGFEVVDGVLQRYTQGQLVAGEPDFETVPGDCRVMGSDVHALADAFTEPDATQAAPVEAAPVVEAPDPERRLAALRALAGTAQWKRGRDGVQQWRFTGIQGLVEKEKSEGRKRSHEQTIRGDLREAAQAESMEKRNGWNK